MALLAVEGWDKYGGPNTNGAAVAALLTAGEWTSTVGTPSIVAPLSATGNALGLGTASSLTRTLPASYGRLIGGVRFSSNLAQNVGVQFLDVATAQAGISINTTGTVSVRSGNFSVGTALGTSAASVSANTTHYLEWDITFGNSGSFQLWLDGVSILGPTTADTTATANNTASSIQIAAGTGGSMTADDFYLFDASGTVNNAPLLTSPRVETQFPSGDGAVQFTAGAAVIGSTTSRTGTNVSPSANQMRLRAIIPVINCTLNSVSLLAGSSASSGTIQIRPVVYSGAGTIPGALLGSGPTVTGVTAGTAKNMPLTSPVALNAGTTYFIGHMCDVALTGGWSNLSATNDDLIAASTFASGAPSTAPVMSGTGSTVIWGSVSVTGNNWYAVNVNPPQGTNSYVFDSVVGHEDLYTYPVLSSVPALVHAVAVKASLQKSDSGARTISMRMSSAGIDDPGSAAGQAPGTSFAWLRSIFPVDPATGAAWTGAALNAATSGVKIDS